MDWEWTWDNFLNLELFRIGEFRLISGNLLVAILQLFGTWLFLFLLRKIIVRQNDDVGLAQKARRYTIFIITKYVVWTASIIVMLEVIGVRITFVLAGATALLVSVGLGLQHIFRDFFSGLFLLFEGTVQVGDIIEANGEVGKVIEMNLRSSEILTRDQVTIIIPNSKFIEEKVVNWTHNAQHVRFTVDVGVSYDSDVNEVMQLLREVMLDQKSVLSKPKPFVRFVNFGESTLDFELNFWSKQAFEIENVKSDLRIAIFNKLKENNIRIPFPQRDLHVTGIEQQVEFKKREN